MTEEKGLGWRPDVPDVRDLDFRAAFTPELKEKYLPPAALIARSRLPEVFDQRRTSSCVGNAVSTMMTFARRVETRSRMFIYYEARRLINETNQDAGCYIRDAIKVVTKLGAPREDLWPFKEANLFVDPNFKADEDAKHRKIFRYARLNNREDYRTCLAEGEGYPFVIGFAVYGDFMSPRTAKFGIQGMPDPNSGFLGGHAVTVIGYDSNFRESKWAKEAVAQGFPLDLIPNDVYICRNSWGERWGRKGDFAIDAKYFEHTNLAADAWTVRNFR